MLFLLVVGCKKCLGKEVDKLLTLHRVRKLQIYYLLMEGKSHVRYGHGLRYALGTTRHIHTDLHTDIQEYLRHSTSLSPPTSFYVHANHLQLAMRVHTCGMEVPS